MGSPSASAIDGAGSVETRIVLWPSRAHASASAHETEVFPTPPFPPTISTGGSRSTTSGSVPRSDWGIVARLVEALGARADAVRRARGRTVMDCSAPLQRSRLG